MVILASHFRARMDLPKKKPHLESGLNQRDRAKSAAVPIKSFVKTTGILRFLGRDAVIERLFKRPSRFRRPNPAISNGARSAYFSCWGIFFFVGPWANRKISALARNAAITSRFAPCRFNNRSPRRARTARRRAGGQATSGDRAVVTCRGAPAGRPIGRSTRAHLALASLGDPG